MADILNQPIDPKILGPLMSALIQRRFQQQDPVRQIQEQQLQFELEQRKSKQALVDQARARLGLSGSQPQGPAMAGGLPGDAGGGDTPITYGRNPRTGVQTFNNLGWVGDTSALPDNQQRVAQHLNNETIVGRQQQAQPTPMEPKAMQSIAQMAMDLNLAGVPGAVQDLILEKMFGSTKSPKLGEEEKIRLTKGLEAQNQEAAGRRGFVRDMLKTQAAGPDPKRYEQAQQAYSAARDQGKTPEEAAAIARAMGFDVQSAYQNSPLVSWLAGQVEPSSVILKPTGSPMQQILREAGNLPEAIQQVTGLAQGRGAPGAAPSPASPQKSERVVVTKGGKDFSLPASQLKDAEKQGYKLKK